ncbi:MAG: prepilin peptidase [Clostridia bacterium]
MNFILYILIFCIGALTGSFFTLAIYRIPLKKDITHERSFCPNCNHKLSFFDLIPILSYIFLGGKCRYCKQKIRPRYLLIEILSGLVFVLFAMSLRINLFTTNISTIVYFIVGLLYFTTLFIIAGIDKEKIKIEKSVLLFGYIIQAIYIIYLYIVEKNTNIYRYVIYLTIICVLILLDTFILRKKVKNEYAIQVLLLCMMFLIYTFEAVTYLTILLTLLTIAIKILLQKLLTKKHKTVIKTEKKQTIIPVGFYLCISNIICLLIANFSIFYRG